MADIVDGRRSRDAEEIVGEAARAADLASQALPTFRAAMGGAYDRDGGVPSTPPRTPSAFFFLSIRSCRTAVKEEMS